MLSDLKMGKHVRAKMFNGVCNDTVAEFDKF